MTKKIKKYDPSSPKNVDIDFLIDNFDTVEERLEYIFSDIDFTKMRKYLEQKPKREDFSEIKINEKMKAFLRNKKNEPKEPYGRMVREGTQGNCPYCDSTTKKRFIWFGISIGCVNNTCENYYKFR
jgi:hypothetical protein